MTKEEGLDWLYRLKSEIYVYMPKEWIISMNNALDMAIKELEQEPCDKCVYSTKDGCCQYDDITETIPPFEPCGDAVSRKAINNLRKYNLVGGISTISLKDINKLPPVNPQEPKTGHWIELGCVGNDNYDFKCSECHHTDTHSKTVKVNYCWYCGAKMAESEGEHG